jgi:hypothetical protein
VSYEKRMREKELSVFVSINTQGPETHAKSFTYWTRIVPPYFLSFISAFS